MLHIHKVAELMGVTVRTLRYYDKIELIHPASKTEGGHRLYTVEELKRLQQVQFLKKGGFSLNEIKNSLDSPEWDWSQSLQKQLASVLEEQKKLADMESALRELINSISLEGGNEESALQKLLQLSTQHQEIRQQLRTSLFTKKEMALLNKVPNVADNSIETEEWILLLNQLKQHMHEGIHSPRIQKIISRMDEKRLAAFAGEDDFVKKLWHVRLSPEKAESFGLYPLEQNLLVFLEQAYTVYEAQGEEE